MIKNYKNIIDIAPIENLKMVFTKDVFSLNKEEILYRERFVVLLEQKYNIIMNDINNSTDIKHISGDIYSVSVNQKKDLFFIFRKHNNLNDNELTTIEFYVDKEIDDFVKKNRGRTFFVIDTETNFTLLNTKDYYDLFLIKQEEEKNKIYLTSVGEEFQIKSITKRIKQVFRKMKITK